jgi:hypothetical protein
MLGVVDGEKENTGIFSKELLVPYAGRWHIYLPANGRINVAGLSKSCIEKVALAIDTIVRKDMLVLSKEACAVVQHVRLLQLLLYKQCRGNVTVAIRCNYALRCRDDR